MMLSRRLERRLVTSTQTLVMVALSHQLLQLLLTTVVTGTSEICRRAHLLGVKNVVWFILTSKA